MPPEMVEAMKDTRMVMKGSTWVSTSTAGASEFITFQEAARAAGMPVPATLFGGQTRPIRCRRRSRAPRAYRV